MYIQDANSTYILDDDKSVEPDDLEDDDAVGACLISLS